MDKGREKFEGNRREASAGYRKERGHLRRSTSATISGFVSS
jgi:hypothetical protein